MNDFDLHGQLIGRQGSRLDLNTPVLLVDIEALDRNIASMARFAAGHGLKLRPHAKTHKSPDIAKRQIAAGAIGACCAKLGEAEALAEGGVTNGLHLTSPVVPAPAIARLVALNLRTAGLMCVVDHPDNVRALGKAAEASGKTLIVIIDIDPGIRRTGVGSAKAAVELLSVIQSQPSLSYGGIQCYCGMQQHIESFDARRESMHERADYIRTVISALAEAGGAPTIITGGGTGTFSIDAELDLFTELQVGSYVFMDSQYMACALTKDNAAPFETALMIDSRVISANAEGMVTLDAGIKAFSTDAEPPLVLSGAPSGAQYFFMGDEHGALLTPDATPPALGSLVTLAAPHCDPTVNLYDTFHIIQGDTLVALWPVAGRGRSR